MNNFKIAILYREHDYEDFYKRIKEEFFSFIKEEKLNITQKSKDYLQIDNTGFYFVNVNNRDLATFFRKHKDIPKIIAVGNYVYNKVGALYNWNNKKYFNLENVIKVYENDFYYSTLVSYLSEKVEIIDIFEVTTDNPTSSRYIITPKTIFDFQFNSNKHFKTELDAYNYIANKSKEKQKVIEKSIAYYNSLLEQEKTYYNSILSTINSYDKK